MAGGMILQEDGAHILQEDGAHILQEDAVAGSDIDVVASCKVGVAVRITMLTGAPVITGRLTTAKGDRDRTTSRALLLV